MEKTDPTELMSENRSDDVIERIETIPIRVPLTRTYAGSYYRMTHRSTIVTKVITRDGAVGVSYAADEDSTLAEIDGIITREIAPRVIGQNALATERVWELANPVTFDQLRDRRTSTVAVASVDNAMWDLVGKAPQRPAVAALGRVPRSGADHPDRRLLRHGGRARG